MKCPFAKSDMTPCVLRDGEICFAIGARDYPICVGCERGYEALGVPRPLNWDRIVAEARRPPKGKRR